jgi:hypothetical protein
MSATAAANPITDADRITEAQWTARLQAERAAGTLTLKYYEVLSALFSFWTPHSGCFPAHETIRQRVVDNGIPCSVRTVQRALNQAARLGLIFWQKRRQPRGNLQPNNSNLYSFHLPTSPPDPGLRPVWSKRSLTGQTGAIKARKEEKEAQERTLAAQIREAATAGDLLSRRRDEFRRRQMEELSRKHG